MLDHKCVFETSCTQMQSPAAVNICTEQDCWGRTNFPTDVCIRLCFDVSREQVRTADKGKQVDDGRMDDGHKNGRIGTCKHKLELQPGSSSLQAGTESGAGLQCSSDHMSRCKVCHEPTVQNECSECGQSRHVAMDTIEWQW